MLPLASISSGSRSRVEEAADRMASAWRCGGVLGYTRKFCFGRPSSVGPRDFFFARGRALNGLAGRHRDVEGHDQDQAVGVAELGVLNAEAARFEVGEHRLDAPAGRILKRIRVFPGLQATRSGTSR